MKAITSNKWVMLLVIFLVLTNLALVFFAFSSSVKTKKHENNFCKSIGLNEEQEKVFDQRKDAFMKSMRPRWEEVNKLKDSLYQHIGDENVSDSMIEHYTRTWTEVNRQSDIALFKHFKELREEVNEPQLKAYDSAVNKMVTRRRH